jgi:hypothetical protein
MKTILELKKLIEEQRSLPGFVDFTEEVISVISLVNERLSNEPEGLKWDVLAVASTSIDRDIKVTVYGSEFVDFTLDDLELLDKIESIGIELHCEITWFGESVGNRPFVFVGTDAINLLTRFASLIRIFNESGDYDIEAYLVSLRTISEQSSI